jgi:hypothetical protein
MGKLRIEASSIPVDQRSELDRGQWNSLGGKLLGARSVLPAILVTAMTLYFFALRNIHGWTFLPFGDEAGHLLGALTLHMGDTLYDSYIDAHGPVIFMLTQLYGWLSGWHDLTYARTISTMLAVFAGLSVVCSSALCGVLARLWAAALFFGVLASVWILQALFMDSYHSVAGEFVIVGLALFVVPTWLGRAVPSYGVFASGACFAMVCFTAYSYGPSIVLLSISGLLPLVGARHSEDRPGTLRLAVGALVLGGLTGSAVVLVWLAVFGDTIGFLVYHVIINQVYYPRYIGFDAANFLRSFHPTIGPATIVHLIGLICFFLALIAFLGVVLAARRGIVRSGVAILIGFAAIAMLDARGSTIFQNGTFLMTAISLAALAVPQALVQLKLAASLPRLWLATGLVAAVVAGAEFSGRQAVASPSGYTRAQIVAAPSYHYGLKHDALFDEIRGIVGPDERILVLVYNPDFLLSVGRLPMKKYHAYLPWEADYAKKPWFGRNRDLCVDLEASPPPVV